MKRYWTEEEAMGLLQCLEQGWPMEKAAKYVGRTVKACRHKHNEINRELERSEAA